VKKLLVENESPLLKQLTIQQRPGKTSFRFWQEGPGYDRNLDNWESIKAGINYIHLNPVRRGLCENVTDYRWSSARFYHLEEYQSDPALPRIDGINHELIETDSEGISTA